MKNQEIAKIFNDIADLLEIKGENPFRIRAYRRAAQNIEGFSKDVSETSKDELMKIPGIGQDLAGKIEEYVKTGNLQFYEDLKKEVPGGLSTLLSLPSLGPKTAKLLFEKLKVKDLETLERLAKDHKLFGLPGIKEIDILDTSEDPIQVMSVFVHLPYVKDVLMQGPTKSSVIIHEGLQVDLRVVEEESFGAALAYFTGSKAHNIRLREMAVKLGLKINEYGIFREKDDKKLGGKEEEDIYRVLGLPFIPPEWREDSGEIEAAVKGRLPRLVELKDIKGDLHVHSKWSDGSHDFEELTEEARKRGYEYIAITDHSKGLGIARGLTAEKLLNEKKN